MFIILGLGNPGKKYENTWHNIGFIALDEFKKKNNFPGFKLSKKFNALISKKGDIILVKPNTYMNESGKSARLISEYYNSLPLIIHDDIDVIMNRIKVSKGRGSAGHKGVESVFESLDNNDIVRIRIGIMSQEGKEKAEKIVLKNADKKLIKESVNKAVEAVEMYIKEGLEKTMTQYNQ